MANFELAMNGLLGEEGGFAPEDNGRGPVNRGITQRTLDECWLAFKGMCKKLGLPKKVREFTRANTFDFYRAFFWNPIRADEIEDQLLAELVFQMSVNNPPKVAISFAQLALGVEVDGIVGPQTLRAFNELHPKGRKLFAMMYESRLEARYRRLAREDPKRYGDDLEGWLHRLHRLTEKVGKDAAQEGLQSSDGQL